MTVMTLTVPEDLAERLKRVSGQLPRVLELGLRELRAQDQAGFEGASDVFEFLAGLPSPEAVLALRPSPALEARVRYLVERNRTVGLSTDEEQEWEQYEYLEHLVRVAKANAARQVQSTGTPTDSA